MLLFRAFITAIYLLIGNVKLLRQKTGLIPAPDSGLFRAGDS